MDNEKTRTPLCDERERIISAKKHYQAAEASVVAVAESSRTFHNINVIVLPYVPIRSTLLLRLLLLLLFACYTFLSFSVSVAVAIALLITLIFLSI